MNSIWNGGRRFSADGDSGCRPGCRKSSPATASPPRSHFTLDDGRFPTGNQSRIQWEGIDGATVEAIGSVPIDAGGTGSFLRLAETLGSAMNLDHTATVVLAHWPGRASPWYDDLRRIAAYGSILGAFATVTDYFDETEMAGQREDYGADEYRPPYLKQDVAAGRPDPISRWTRYFRRRAVVQATETLRALIPQCAKRPPHCRPRARTVPTRWPTRSKQRTSDMRRWTPD